MQIVTINGGFRVPKDTCIGKWQYETGKLCHDEFLPHAVAPWIKEGDLVIDVGAFDGDHTILYSELVGEKGTVIAIEPGRIANECLVHNKKLFKHQNTIVLAYAMSDEAGWVDHIESDNLGASFCVKKNLDDGERGIVTSSMFIVWDCFANRQPINFIKIDCEGYEMKVLRGSKGILEAFHPVILIEINRGALERNGTSPEEIFDFLGELGYSFFCVNIGLRPNEDQYDVLCERID